MTTGAQRLKLISPAASPEEAAAVVAALEHFMRQTAPSRGRVRNEPDGWARAAILEGLSRAEQGDSRDPWINP